MTQNAVPRITSKITYEELSRTIKGERLPAVIVDLDAFDRNVFAVAAIARKRSQPPHIRVATKSLRVPELISRVLKSGAPYQGLMCYSADEAGFLASLGHDDLMIGYPTVQDSDLAVLKDLHSKGKRITLVIDGVAAVSKLADFMKGCSAPFPVIIEMDASLKLLHGLLHIGVRRSPIMTPSDLLQLAREVLRHKELVLAGVMAYEAQVAGMGDQSPFRRFLNPLIKLIHEMSVTSVSHRRSQIPGVFNQLGLPLQIFNGGGTGSLNYSVKETWLTELTAGSAFLCPHLFDYYSNVSFEPACFFALQAVRVPSPHIITCQGGGYVASGQPGADKLPLPYLPHGSHLLGTEGAGEVQTPVRLASNVALGIGDPVFFRHAKAGELAERFTEYLLVAGGKIVDRVKTYRGSGKGFF